MKTIHKIEVYSALVMLGLLGLVMAIGIYGQINKPSTVKDREYTGHVCTIAHNEINGRSEEECGRLLEKHNLTFKCQGDACWTEEK